MQRLTRAPRSRSGSRPSMIRSRSTGVAAAHACGLLAVGYGTGNGVVERARPVKTSGSAWPNSLDAARSVRAIRRASPCRP